MKRILLACFLLSFPAWTFAITLSALPENKAYIGAGGGDFFARVDDNNQLNTGMGWPPDFYASQNISDQPFFFFSGGYTFARPSNWLPYYSLGLRYTYISTSTVTGYINQYSLPEFKNYYFQYDVQLLTALGTLKVDLYRWNNLMPYLMGGVGVTSFSTSNYSEQALSGVTPRVSPGFGSNSGNNFSYSFGAGLDYALTENIWLNFECNYSDFGTVKTGNGANYSTLTGTNYSNEALKNKISGTAVFAGLTYYPG